MRHTTKSLLKWRQAPECSRACRQQLDAAFQIELVTSEINDVAASMMSVADVKKLTVLVQADHDQSDDEAAFGAR